MSPTKLAELPTTRRHFWKASFAEFYDFIKGGVVELNFDSNDRRLPPNEIITLALNEITAEKSQGFFWHLPSRCSSSRE
jgi:hypothetical protein